jgi:shikimate 5-dehydrogenase
VSASPAPDRYALMGHPVNHSWSPFVHGLFARATQQNMQYRMIDVPPERFRAEALQFFVDGGKGLNITVPHKQAAAELVNVLTMRAEELAREFARHGTLVASGFDTIEAAPFDLVINATAASLEGSVPAVTPAAIGPGTVCYDMSYAKGETPFTRYAREHGAKAAHRGWGMLVEQAAESFLVWRGIRPPTRPVLALLAAGVTSPA